MKNHRIKGKTGYARGLPLFIMIFVAIGILVGPAAASEPIDDTFDLPELEAPLFESVITATKTDNLAPGTAVDPGDTLQYSVVVANNGDEDATDVVFEDTIDPNTTLVPDSLTVTPLAFGDSYATVGNTELVIDAANGLLANDSDPDSASGLSIVPFSGASDGGGTVNINADGSFNYTPPPGATSDSFGYTLQDEDGLTDTATVAITMVDLVWYVDNSGPNGNGTSSTPFNNLADAQAASRPGHYIFIFEGSGAYSGIVLQDNQKLVGQGVGLTLSPNVSIPATNDPTLTSAEDGIVLAQNNEVRGLTVSNSASEGIVGQGIDSATISDVTVDGGSDEGMLLVDVTGTVLISNSTIRNMPADGLFTENFSGTLNLTVDSSTFDNNLTDAIQVRADSSAVINFSATNSSFTDNNIGLNLNSHGSGEFNFLVDDNVEFSGPNSFDINVFAADTSTMQGTISNNDAVATGEGIRIVQDADSSLTIAVINNVIEADDLGGAITVLARDGSGRLDITLDNNTATAVGPDTLEGIFIQARDDNTICANIINNTASSDGLDGIAVVQSGASVFLIQGLSGDPTTFLAAQNPATSDTITASGSFGSGTCNTVAMVEPDHNDAYASTPKANAALVALTSMVEQPELDPAGSRAGGLASPLAPSDLLQNDSLDLPLASGETVTVNIGTLPAGKDVTITFQVTIDDPLPFGLEQVSNQGTVSGSNVNPVDTEDVDEGGPTVTPVNNETASINDFVVLGIEGVLIEKDSEVNSGDIGVNVASGGPFLDSGVEMSIKKNVNLLDPNSRVLADSIKVEKDTVLHDLFYNDIDLDEDATVGGQFTPLPLPLLAELPSVPEFNPGPEDIEVDKNETVTIDAGSYGLLEVDKDSTLIFSGGVYDFESWDVDKNVEFLFEAPSQIQINGRLNVDKDGYLGPAPAASIGATDIVIYINGQNDDANDPKATPLAAMFGKNETIIANIVALNGTLKLDKDSNVTGALLGKWIFIEKNVELTLDNGF